MNKDLERYSHFDLLFPSDYLKAGDLGGHDVVMTIADIEPRHKLKTTDGKAQAKPLLHFVEGGIKPMVLNKTNAKVLRKLYGSEATVWIGKAVSLYSAEIEAFGDVVDAIRFRKKIPMTAPAVGKILGQIASIPAARANDDTVEWLRARTGDQYPPEIREAAAKKIHAVAVAGVIADDGGPPPADEEPPHNSETGEATETAEDPPPTESPLASAPATEAVQTIRSILPEASTEIMERLERVETSDTRESVVAAAREKLGEIANFRASIAADGPRQGGLGL